MNIKTVFISNKYVSINTFAENFMNVMGVVSRLNNIFAKMVKPDFEVFKKYTSSSNSKDFSINCSFFNLTTNKRIIMW